MWLIDYIYIYIKYNSPMLHPKSEGYLDLNAPMDATWYHAKSGGRRGRWSIADEEPPFSFRMGWLNETATLRIPRAKRNRWLWGIPSGKLTWKWKITIFNGKIHYKWPFSIAMLNYQRVIVILYLPNGKSTMRGESKKGIWCKFLGGFLKLDHDHEFS